MKKFWFIFLLFLFFILFYCGNSKLNFRKQQSRTFFSKFKAKPTNLNTFTNYFISTLFTRPIISTFSRLLLSSSISFLTLLNSKTFSSGPFYKSISKSLTSAPSQTVFKTILQNPSSFFKSKNLKASLFSEQKNNINKLYFFTRINESQAGFTFKPSLFSFSSLNLTSNNFFNLLFSLNDFLNTNQLSEESVANIQDLVADALGNLFEFLFNEHHNETFQTQYKRLPNLTKLSRVFFKSSKNLKIFMKYIYSLLATIKDGMQRYDLNESECQTRLICELHNKALNRTLRSWITMLFKFFGIDKMDSFTFTARTKSILKDFYEVAKKGFNEEDCALNFLKCPVSIAIEPSSNSLMANFLKYKLKKTNEPSKSSLTYHFYHF